MMKYEIADLNLPGRLKEGKGVCGWGWGWGDGEERRWNIL